MTSDAILVELRSLPGAPDSLRERVRSLPEPQPRFAWTLPRIDLRRALLVAAPAVAAFAQDAAAPAPANATAPAAEAPANSAAPAPTAPVDPNAVVAKVGDQTITCLLVTSDRAAHLPW